MRKITGRILIVAWVTPVLMLGLGGCQSKKPREIGKPPVIPRVSWSGLMESGSFRSQTPESIVIFSVPYKLEEGEQTFAKFLVRLQGEHINKKKWGDIGYHYFVAPTGETYAGRQIIFKGRMEDWKETEGRILVAVLGNYQENAVTPELAFGLGNLITWMVHDLKIPVEKVYTPGDLKEKAPPAAQLDSFVHQILIPEVKDRILYKEHPEKFQKERKPKKEERMRMETLQKYGE